MKSRWYGWQTLLVDAAAAGFASTGSDVSVGIYALGGPAVHWAHGNTWRGIGSLALRLGAPIALAAAFAYGCEVSGNSNGDMGCLGAGLGGLVLGAAGAIAVDSAALARDTVPIDEDIVVRVGAVHVAPAMAVGRDRGSFLLQGTF